MRSDPTKRTPEGTALYSDYAAEVGGFRAAVLDALGEAVIATDVGGRIIYWNDAATRLYGWNADEVIGSRILDVTTAEGMREYVAKILAVVGRGQEWSGVFMAQARDGNVIPVQATITGVRDEDDALAGMVGVSRDISTRHEAESALRESEERLDLVRRAAASVIWELDPETGLFHWSDALTDVFGYDLASVGRSKEWWLDRIHADDRARMERSLEAFLEEGRRFWTQEYRFRRVDGTFAEVFDRAYAAHDAAGTPTRIVGAMVDLTERRKLQEEQRLLAQSGMILDLSMDYESTVPTLVRLVVNSMADFAVLHLRPEHRLPPFTAAVHSDPSRQSLIEEIAEFLAAAPPEGGLIARVLRTGESVLLPRVPDEMLANPSTPERLRSLIGEVAPASGMVVPVRARDALLGFIILGRTERRDRFTETDLLVVEELSRRIGQAVETARLYQSAELAKQAKSDFLSVISHELRTPLTAIMGYADLLAQEVTGPLNEGQKKQILRIKAGTDRLLRLLESILAFVRLETGHEEAHLCQIDVPDLLSRVEEIVAPRAREQGVEFRIESCEDLNDLITDPDRFVQIIMALLTNALKFTSEGAVLLRVSRDESHLLFDVEDTGHGIPEEHLPYVFNPFWQVEQPATRRAGGAGLGLSVARRMARLMGGDVVVAHSSPTGTTLRLRLPTTTPA
jgi:PAS domain S-box-containing protein